MLKETREYDYKFIKIWVEDLLPINEKVVERDFILWEELKAATKFFLGDKWEEYFLQEYISIPPHYSAVYGTCTYYTGETFITRLKKLPQTPPYNKGKVYRVEKEHDGHNNYFLYMAFPIYVKDGKIQQG